LLGIIGAKCQVVILLKKFAADAGSINRRPNGSKEHCVRDG
jgi:hypothetical protein